MTNEEENLSGVVPYLLAILVCDSGTIDQNSGKKTLVGIFDRVIAEKFSTSRWLSVYFKLSDAEGNYQFKVQYAQVETGNILAEAETDVLIIKSRLDIRDFLITYPAPLPIPEAGQYEFRLFANNIFLGHITIDAAMPRERKE